MLERNCKIHFEPIVLKDDNNQDQCKVCFKNECFDKMIKIDKIIILCKKILNQSKENNETTKISKTLDLINKYKLNLPKLFNERRDQQNWKLQQAIIVQDQKYKKFNYKLKQDYPINKDCYQFVLNQDFTRLFIGQNFSIKVYEFKNGQIQKYLQTLTKHTNKILSLILMIKSNILVSGSMDQSIVIWNQDKNGSWKLQQILEGHKNDINCLVNNEDEDLLISASYDYTIKFWKKTNMNWSCYQTIQALLYPLSLSLSKSQTKLISCGISKDIFVMEQKAGSQWIISYTLNTNTSGQHVLFISDNQFVYQGMEDQLQIYLYDQEQKQFVQDKQINVQKYNGHINSFPCKYIEQKNIFLIKNGRFFNCFRIDQSQNYILQQTIEYDYDFYGNISNNGQYIIVRQYFQHTVEIRELQYLE